MTKGIKFNKYRTHTCGELRKKQEKHQVILMGWLAKKRHLGGLIFLDLRDQYGITQIVVDPQLKPDLAKFVSDFKHEYVLAVKGEVCLRPNAMINQQMPTGEIEVRGQSITHCKFCL